MEKHESKRIVLKWNIDKFGLFEVIIWDGKITDVRMCKNGSLLESEVLWATSGSEGFLKEVYKCLGELLQYMEVKKNENNKS